MDYQGGSAQGGTFLGSKYGKEVLFSGWRYVKWRYLFRERYIKGIPFQGMVCEKVPIFQNLVCERVRGPDLRQSPLMKSSEYPLPPPLKVKGIQDIYVTYLGDKGSQ